MRMAKDIEVIAAFGSSLLQSVCEVSGATVSRWRRNREIPEPQLLKVALRFPHRLIVDDDGVAWWLDEISFTPPDWVPRRWWDAYVHMRQTEQLACEEKDLQEVVAELDRLRVQGHDVGLALRYATVKKLTMPVAATREVGGE